MKIRVGTLGEKIMQIPNMTVNLVSEQFLTTSLETPYLYGDTNLKCTHNVLLIGLV